MQNFLFTSDIFRGSRYEKGHPLDMDRVWPSVELIKLMGWVKEDQIIKNSPADISELIKFHDFFGEPIPRSTLYKSLKSLVKKKLVKHLGSERSSLYSF